MMKAFQTLFPPLSPQTISLSSARRVVLIAYNAERGTVDFRHFRIGVRAAGVSRRVRRVIEPTKSSKSSAKMATPSAETSSAGGGGKSFINLGMEKDIADFVLGTGGYETASSAESEVDEAGEVALASDYVGRNNKKGSKRAVRLDEIGPRMELRLIKISEGIPGKEGEVMFHEFGKLTLQFLNRLLCIWLLMYALDFFLVHKTKKEVSSLKAAHAEKERLRKQRREEQERNVARKKAEKEKSGNGAESSDDESVGMDDNDVDEDVEQDDDDDAWNDEEDASEGGEDDEDESLAEESEENEDEAPQAKPPPTKKVKFQRKR
jgi:ribosome biogenesis protein SSF1/2